MGALGTQCEGLPGGEYCTVHYSTVLGVSSVVPGSVRSVGHERIHGVRNGGGVRCLGLSKGGQGEPIMILA